MVGELINESNSGTFVRTAGTDAQGGEDRDNQGGSGSGSGSGFGGALWSSVKGNVLHGPLQSRSVGDPMSAIEYSAEVRHLTLECFNHFCLIYVICTGSNQFRRQIYSSLLSYSFFRTMLWIWIPSFLLWEPSRSSFEDRGSPIPEFELIVRCDSMCTCVTLTGRSMRWSTDKSACLYVDVCMCIYGCVCVCICVCVRVCVHF